MRPLILLTRPLVASQRWAQRLDACGFDSLIAPLLTIVPTGAPRPSGRFHLVMMTSAHALRDESLPLEDLKDLPCFCVGQATAEAARRRRFKNIHVGTSGGAALVSAITQSDTYTPNMFLLHLAGTEIAFETEAAFDSHTIRTVPWVTYRAEASLDLPSEVVAALEQCKIAAVPVFSPRSARILVELIAQRGLTSSCRSILALGLSQAVGAVLEDMPWNRLVIAAQPSSESMLAYIQRELP